MYVRSVSQSVSQSGSQANNDIGKDKQSDMCLDERIVIKNLYGEIDAKIERRISNCIKK